MSASYFHLDKHIYLSFFRDEAIILDLIKDQYFILSDKHSAMLQDMIDGKCHAHETNALAGVEHKQLCDFVMLLQNKRVLSHSKHNSIYPFYVDNKKTASGVEDIDWRLPLSSIDISFFNMNVLRALYLLLKMHSWLKFRGFYHMVKLIKHVENKYHSSHITPTKAEMMGLVTSLNKACYLYPFEIKCLVWSSTLVLLALNRGWKCNLVIGVQNYPFLAHAWPECDGKVIADSQHLPEQMSIILQEPFRPTRVV